MATKGYALIDATLDAVPISMGGTGGITVEDARNNLKTAGILSTTTGINGKVVAQTNLYTVPGGKSAIIVGLVVRITTATALTGTLRSATGTNVGANNIYASTLMSGFNTTTQAYYFNTGAVRAIAAAAGIVKFNIITAFGGTTATLAVDLIGYLI